MSNELEQKLHAVVNDSLAYAYIEINNTFSNSITPFNKKWDSELEEKFITMVKDSVRMNLWLNGDINGN